MGRMTVRIGRLGLVAAALPALLATSPAIAARDRNAVIAQACAVKPDETTLSGEVLRLRLAEAVLSQAGVLGSELLSDANLAAAAAMCRPRLTNQASPAGRPSPAWRQGRRSASPRRAARRARPPARSRRG